MQADSMEWLERAREDQVAMLRLDVRSTPNVIGSLCHQSVEKIIKACISQLGLPVDKKHDLRVLWNQIKDNFPSNAATANFEQTFTNFEALAVEARYPGLNMNEEEAKQSVEDAKFIFSYLEAWLKAQV